MRLAVIQVMLYRELDGSGPQERTKQNYRARLPYKTSALRGLRGEVGRRRVTFFLCYLRYESITSKKEKSELHPESPFGIVSKNKWARLNFMPFLKT